MGRVAVVLAGVAVLAIQVWLTLYAQVALAYEAAVIAVVLVGVGLRGYARSRRRRQRADLGAARWPGADAIPVPQPTALVGGAALPPVDAGVGAPPVPTQVENRGDPLDDLLTRRRPRPVG